METKILFGLPVRDEIEAALKEEIALLPAKPKLAIIQVGERGESAAYIRQKIRFGEKVGAVVSHESFPEEISEQDLEKHVRNFGSDERLSGIIVQLPLPPHIDAQKIISAIPPEKDVDGLTDRSVRTLWSGKGEGFMPATPKGVLRLLDHYEIPIEGKHVVIIGRSELVGKPLAHALLNRNATVTVCHSQTKGLPAITRGADIIISAVGIPKLVNESHVSPGQTILDVGLTVTKEQGKNVFLGDADFEALQGIVGAITPVPGGVGPLTVASLFENLLLAHCMQAPGAM